MQSFRLTLANNGVVQGAHAIPTQSPSPVRYRPLIVALHGGGYDHQYFDALPGYSASLMSNALTTPFVTIDRPSYGGTSSILPIPSGSDFTTESAIQLHRLILPKLWEEFDVPHGYTCIVLLCHSLSVVPGIAVAALYRDERTPEHPLRGIIASGIGNTQS